jgi:hypothetical protein
MSPLIKAKEEVKAWIYYVAIKLSDETSTKITYEDVNSALIEILHENNKHNPQEPFKK